jgi:hypothetical protein
MLAKIMSWLSYSSGLPTVCPSALDSAKRSTLGVTSFRPGRSRLFRGWSNPAPHLSQGEGYMDAFDQLFKNVMSQFYVSRTRSVDIFTDQEFRDMTAELTYIAALVNVDFSDFVSI